MSDRSNRSRTSGHGDSAVSTHDLRRQADGPRVSVLMPTFGQETFLPRAVASLFAQTLSDWELIVIDDGSPGDVAGALGGRLGDRRVELLAFERNRGLGAALNAGLDRARAPLVAYLPSDDVVYEKHLELLVSTLEANDGAVLAFSGVKREHRVPGKGVLFDGTSQGRIEGYPLQLVQVAHRRTDDRWAERAELTTDDLDWMFWAKLRPHGSFVGTGEVTCEWVDHPLERHKTIREPLGGLNPYRARYRVAEPLRFHSTVGNPTDEVEHYRRFRERPDTRPAPDGLTIVLCGELAFNPERVLALEERGHRLYGLWTDAGHWFNTVGPLPFGHVEDLPREDWRAALRRLQPDVIYALLNWEAVPLAHEVLSEATDIPFVWHFKEGPFDCIANGTWPLLVDLHTRSDGQVYSTREMREWFRAALPETTVTPSLVLDGDLPKREWFAGTRSQLLSERDGEVHTLVAGGPIGLEPDLVGALAARGIHLHFYGSFHQGQWGEWIEAVRAAAGNFFHLHGQVDHDRWVSEFSRYDAGWLHLFTSTNGGDIRRTNWPDLNVPARLPTLAAAGVPPIQRANDGHVVAQQRLVRELDAGLFLRNPDQLADELQDRERMRRLRETFWATRADFTFDFHADRLIRFFREVASCGARSGRRARSLVESVDGR